MSLRTSILTVTAFTAAAVLTGTTVTYAQPTENAPSPADGKALTQAYFDTASALNETASSAAATLAVLNEKITVAEAEQVSTDALTDLYNSMLAEAEALKQFTPINLPLGPSATSPSAVLSPVSFKGSEATVYQNLLTPLTVSAPKAAEAWENELHEEQERIRVAEEERLRQEEAARQAQAEQARRQAASAPAAQRSTSAGTAAPRGGQPAAAPSNTPAPAAEDASSRAARVMGTLPFSIGFTLSNECGGVARVLGCYSMGNTISLAPRMLNDPAKYPDCRVQNVIAHEYRHYLQKQEGSIQWDESGAVTNRDWLEADANAWASSYGC